MMTDQDKLNEVTAKLLGGHEVLFPNPQRVAAGNTLHVTQPVFVNGSWVHLKARFDTHRAGTVIGVIVSPDLARITGLIWL